MMIHQYFLIFPPMFFQTIPSDLLFFAESSDVDFAYMDADVKFWGSPVTMVALGNKWDPQVRSNNHGMTIPSTKNGDHIKHPNCMVPIVWNFLTKPWFRLGGV